jgi:ABC-type multidrug transport system permease subunit
MGPAFDSEGIMTGIYLACFLAPIILYLLPYLIGVNIVITKRNIYSSNAKKGILGLEVGVIGGVLLLILEIVTISYSDGFKLDLSFLYFPLGYTIISSALFIIIPRFFKV